MPASCLVCSCEEEMTGRLISLLDRFSAFLKSCTCIVLGRTSEGNFILGWSDGVGFWGLYKYVSRAEPVEIAEPGRLLAFL